jgi:hypothetical protein
MAVSSGGSNRQVRGIIGPWPHVLAKIKSGTEEKVGIGLRLICPVYALPLSALPVMSDCLDRL